MRNKFKGLGPLVGIALTLLLAVLAGLATVTPAHASLSSGLPSGPVGTPVISTVAYTNSSDVLVVGDSITVRSYKALAAQLSAQAPSKRLAVNAQSGANTAQSIDRLIVQLNAGMKLPPELVMATGANDIFAPAAMQAQVKRLLSLVAVYAPTTRVFWVNVSVARPGYLFADHVNSGKVNQLIRAGCTGRCSVISWANLLATGTNRAKYIDAGGVHPNAAGQIAWGKLIAGAL